MATVSYNFVSWGSGGPIYDLQPGGVHSWSVWDGGFDYGDAILANAHPVGRGRALAVENFQVRSDPNGLRMATFNVRNVGSRSIPGYGIGIAMVDN